MRTNRQARHILGLDYKLSNQRKVVRSDDDGSEKVVTHRHGRHRRAQ
ncbi:stationary-phase-induced ribosome-associated protein [Pseudescherichia vulneris]|nr:stationary-phase-induced ribosome-associated protein [Pseudescherichia vulneris]WAH52920.1 stationary-phase-induced ribosome-associated protein [Pseudescherichia vulneris]